MRTTVVRLELPGWLEQRRFAGLPAIEHWRRRLHGLGLQLAEPGSDPALPALDGARLSASDAEILDVAAGGAPASPPATPATVALAERAWVSGRVQALCAAGVVVHDPERVWVDTTVEVEPGAVLWGGCVLRGRTVVGPGAVVHPGAVLDDTEVGAGSEVKAHSVCEGARIGPACAVGPMAHLRAGAVLHDDVKVGNFVEVKQATLRAGVRASHLTYLGDADVGERANVGAGTITCNYDGFGKHRTVIGAGAFVGSNSSLVAPVRIGAGAIVGAGSTVTRDVPDEALMVERAEERILPGRAARVRERNRVRAGKER